MSLDRDLLEEYQTRYDQTLGKKHFIIKRVMKKSISDEVVNVILSDWVMAGIILVLVLHVIRALWFALQEGG